MNAAKPDLSAATGGGQVADATRRLGQALGKRALAGATKKIGSATENLGSLADGKLPGGSSGLASAAKGLAEGHSPLRAAADAGMSTVKDKVSGGAHGLMDAVGLGGGGGGGGDGDGGGGKKIKVTNIVEMVDVAVPIDVAYDQWTMFTDFPTFMKKVEHVEQEEDDKLTWQAQVFWSHRSWTSTIIEQTPEERIVWRSSGDKGYVDGAVSFHELAPSLTRVALVLEYHPKGFFEHVGNIWRAQGRRARLELKHYQRHVMTQTILNTEELEGWRGEIHDGEVVSPEEVEQRESGGEEQGETDEDEREFDEEYDEDEAEDQDEGEPENRDEEEEPDEDSDEYAAEDEGAEEDADEDAVAGDGDRRGQAQHRRGAERTRRQSADEHRSRARTRRAAATRSRT
jgi:hypothetical protein